MNPEDEGTLYCDPKAWTPVAALMHVSHEHSSSRPFWGWKRRRGRI